MLLPVISTNEAIVHLVQECFGAAQKSGWWTDLATGESTCGKVNVPEKLCLIHSEISEAMEGYRKSLQDDHIPDRPKIEVELADALIRICGLAGGMGYDLAGAVVDKLAYNAKRLDHTLAARQAASGKKF